MATEQDNGLVKYMSGLPESRTDAPGAGIAGQGGTAGEPSGRGGPGVVSKILRGLLAVAIVAAAAGVAGYWMKNRPTAERRPRPPQARLVEVRPVRLASHQVTVRAMGTVIPSQRIDVASRAAGTVIEVSPNFVPGGFFSAGETILKVDPADYALAVAQRESELIRAQADLRTEQGRQATARREYELLGKEIREEDRDLVLRGPQLAMARAAVAAAEAALERAKLDLARTNVTAPFAATVQQRVVDLGSQVSVGMPLATLCGTDTYWVRVLVPVDELAWIDIPGFNAETGAAVRLYQQAAWGSQAHRTGRVVRLMAELEPQGRMAMLLVAVDDPLDLSSPVSSRRPLILDSYVSVEIDGRAVGRAVRLARSSLREGDKVWVMTEAGELDVREVSIAWSDVEAVLVTEGLDDGDRLVTSDLASPVEGMALRTAEERPADAGDEDAREPDRRVTTNGGAPEAGKEARQ